MHINLEAIDQIPQILNLVAEIKRVMEKGTLDKRWFNTAELSLYTGYKLETIKAKIKRNDFILGVHYYKRDGKLLFDKVEVDNWVMGIRTANNVAYEKETINSVVNDILSSICG